MKRFISLLLVFSVLLCSLAVPVFADSEGSNFLNVLDYATPNNASGYFVAIEAGADVTFTLPYRTYIGYVDFVCRFSGSAPGDVAITIDKDTVSLSVEKIGNGIYRFYGTSNSDWHDLVINFGNTGKSWIEFLSFKISHVAVDSWYADASFIFEPIAGDTIRSDTSTNYLFNATIEAEDVGGLSSYQFRIRIPDWQKYDYVSFNVDAQFSSITSINARVGNVAVPISVSMLDSGVASAGDDTLYVCHSASAIVDLRQLNRDDSNELVIYVNAQYNLSTGAVFECYAVQGMMDTSSVNPIVYWFRTLINRLDGWFDSVIDAINGDESIADDFNAEMESQSAELGEIADAMDSVTKPPIEDMSGSVDDYVSSDDINSVGSVLSSVFENDVILSVFMMALTLTLVSYVLYGKR